MIFMFPMFPQDVDLKKLNLDLKTFDIHMLLFGHI